MSGYKFFDPEYDDFLKHSGTPGMKWHVRKYQYPDGTWTELGKERRRIGERKNYGFIKQSKKKVPPTKELLEFYSTIKEDLEVINKQSDPNNTIESIMRRKNCGYCSIAYELRRRGYDAKAKLTLDGLRNNEICRIFGKSGFDGFKTSNKKGLPKQALDILEKHKVDTSNTPKFLYNRIYNSRFSRKELYEMEKELVSQGDGARGIIAQCYFDGKNPGGHVFNYEVSGGQVYTVDCQSKRVGPGFVNGPFKNTFFLDYVRTDNAKLDEKALTSLFGEKIKRKESK